MIFRAMSHLLLQALFARALAPMFRISATPFGNSRVSSGLANVWCSLRGIGVLLAVLRRAAEADRAPREVDFRGSGLVLAYW
jgi:hypothetical protein